MLSLCHRLQTFILTSKNHIMSNMSYCQFNNTVIDMQQCIDALISYQNRNKEDEFDEHDISKTEIEKAFEMEELCEVFLETFEQVKEATNLERY